MEFTFGIITAGGADAMIQRNVDSIRKQVKCPYEIIIVGETNVRGDNIQNIPFDESIKRGWITRKKNIIASMARQDTLVLMHDYFCLGDDWYEGFVKFGTDYSVCITKVFNHNGSRFRDQCIFPNFLPSFLHERLLLPYSFVPENSMWKLMYISGGQYVIKKDLTLKFPLHEGLAHCEGEDVVFCQQLAREGIKITFNQQSSVHLMKEKYPIQSDKNILSDDMLTLLNSFDDDAIDELFHKQVTEQNKWIYETTGVIINNSIKM